MRIGEHVASWSPYYFGAPEAPLFGCYHPPAAGGATMGGVVLCHPMGHEYMACHRATRQMAVRLAQAGWPALRFDFFGSGDSAGESSEGAPSRWLRDITAARKEIQKRQSGPEVTLMGWRLGATLALLHTQDGEGTEARALILWDPVIDGGAYVAQLRALQRERFGGGDSDEVLGFPFTKTLREELESIDLLKTERLGARRVLMIETGATQQNKRALADRLRQQGSIVEHRSFPGPEFWHEPNKAAVPANIIQSVVSWARSGL